MIHVGDPYSVARAQPPKLGDDYSAAYDLLKNEQEAASQAPPELPHELTQIYSQIGEMVNTLNNIASVLETGVKEIPLLKGKRIDNQIDQIIKIREELFELNNSLIDLKL